MFKELHKHSLIIFTTILQGREILAYSMLGGQLRKGQDSDWELSDSQFSVLATILHDLPLGPGALGMGKDYTVISKAATSPVLEVAALKSENTWTCITKSTPPPPRRHQAYKGREASEEPRKLESILQTSPLPMFN